MTVQEAKNQIEYNVKYRIFTPRVEALQIAIECMQELEQYRALGTVEELKEAREYQIPKKPIKKKMFEDSIMEYWACETCNSILAINQPYCDRCGKAQDWGEEDD